MIVFHILPHNSIADALGHRNKILRLIRKSTQDSQNAKGAANVPPTEFLCPITQELIDDPVLCAGKFLLGN